MRPRGVAILRVLSRDARVSLREISREIRAAISTVSTEIRRMEGEGVIRGYTVQVDPTKLGYDLTAVIGVRISRGRLMEVQKDIASSRNVFAVYDVTGEWDSIVLARFRSRRDLDRFIKRLVSRPHVERTYTFVVLNTVKEDMRVPV